MFAVFNSELVLSAFFRSPIVRASQALLGVHGRPRCCNFLAVHDQATSCISLRRLDVDHKLRALSEAYYYRRQILIESTNPLEKPATSHTKTFRSVVIFVQDRASHGKTFPNSWQGFGQLKHVFLQTYHYPLNWGFLLLLWFLLLLVLLI